MRPMIRWLLPVMILAMAGAQAAKANVIFTFNQTSPTIGPSSSFGSVVQWADVFGAQFVASDAAFAEGVNWVASHPYGNGYPYPATWSVDGLVELYLSHSGQNESFSTNASEVIYQSEPRVLDATQMSIHSSPGGNLVGQIYYMRGNAVEVWFDFYANGMVDGRARSDGFCQYGCTFSGTMTQSVPEPASILTFGLGLLLLGGSVGGARYRRNGAAPASIGRAARPLVAG